MKQQAYQITSHDGPPGDTTISERAAPIGTTVYASGYDYGLASDDTQAFGVEYISVTTNADSTPFFTIPKANLKLITVETPEPPTDEEVKTLCKVGQGAACCRYLVMGSGGWECAKLVPSAKTTLDDRVAHGSMNAQGDNCPGKGSR